jgi:signal transduction histidine kinase
MARGVDRGASHDARASQTRREPPGLFADEDRAGVGTISMHERTEELGGWCTVKRLAGGGTLVRILLPFQSKKDVRVQRNERA